MVPWIEADEDEARVRATRERIGEEERDLQVRGDKIDVWTASLFFRPLIIYLLLPYLITNFNLALLILLFTNQPLIFSELIILGSENVFDHNVHMLLFFFFAKYKMHFLFLFFIFGVNNMHILTTLPHFFLDS